MTDRDLKELETFTIAIAEKAGAYVMTGHGAKQKVKKKSDIAGYVTEFDIGSEKMIVAAIKELYPDDAILAEEVSTEAGTSGYTWVIDPIDGTHNYMHGEPLFAVSIGLKKGDEYIVGVVRLPRLEETYVASKGNGTRRNGIPVHCSNVSEFKDAFLNVETQSEITEIQVQKLKVISHETFRHRMIGSIATTLAFISSGIFDAYIDLHEHANEWDWGGGSILVTEAGGCFEITPHNRVIASNAHLSKEVHRFVSGA